MRFKIEWANLWLEGNIPFLLSFTLYLRATSKYQAPGDLYSEGRLNGGYLRYEIGELKHGEAYFLTFAVTQSTLSLS